MVLTLRVAAGVVLAAVAVGSWLMGANLGGSAEKLVVFAGSIPASFTAGMHGTRRLLRRWAAA